MTRDSVSQEWRKKKIMGKFWTFHPGSSGFEGRQEIKRLSWLHLQGYLGPVTVGQKAPSPAQGQGANRSSHDEGSCVCFASGLAPPLTPAGLESLQGRKLAPSFSKPRPVTANEAMCPQGGAHDHCKILCYSPVCFQGRLAGRRWNT